MSKRGIALVLTATVAVSALAFVGYQSQASSSYTFLVRGYVTQVHHATNKVHVSATYASDRAKADLAGNDLEYSVNGAAFYKWENGIKKRVTWTKSAEVGDEVVMYGTRRNESQTVRWLVVNDRTFTVIGKIKDHDKSAKTMQVAVTSSTYHNSVYAGKDIIIKYDGNTRFTSDGRTVESDDIPASNQRAKFTGDQDFSTWKVTQVWNNY